MRIEIWSDIACPWCYIGKRRLETALTGFEHREDVEVAYRSFQLDPTAPGAGGPSESVATVLGRKYGGGEAGGRQMVDQVQAVAAQEGLEFRHHDSVHANTRDAHRLLHLAAEAGVQAELKERLLRAYFVEAANVADDDVLVSAATEVGLPEDRVREVLAGEEYDAAVQRDIDEASALGATGVPFFVIDRKYAVSGAQPAEMFAQVLDRAWSEAHPTLEVIDGADACGPDGCALPS